MLDFISRMTPGDWITALIGAGGAIATIVGIVWWMSAVYSEQKQTRKAVRAIGRGLKNSHSEWQSESKRHWEMHTKHVDKLTDHEGRIIRLETTVDPDAPRAD